MARTRHRTISRESGRSKVRLNVSPKMPSLDKASTRTHRCQGLRKLTTGPTWRTWPFGRFGKFEPFAVWRTRKRLRDASRECGAQSPPHIVRVRVCADHLKT